VIRTQISFVEKKYVPVGLGTRLPSFFLVFISSVSEENSDGYLSEGRPLLALDPLFSPPERSLV